MSVAYDHHFPTDPRIDWFAKGDKICMRINTKFIKIPFDFRFSIFFWKNSFFLFSSLLLSAFFSCLTRMASELNLNTVEGQYALQVKEFRERTDRMKNATRKMWRLQDGFRESFDATWVDWPELPRRALLKPCAERLESSLPPPFSKSKALLELSCPELTDERL